MDTPANDEKRSLSPQALPPVRQRRAWAIVLLSAMAATVGGFAGAFVAQHGPVYLSVNVVQPAVAAIEKTATPPDEVAPESHSDVPADARPFLQGEEGLLLIHSDDVSYALLSDVTVESWSKGKQRVLGDEMFYLSERQVEQAELPDALAGWPGKEVALYGKKGFVCKARIGEPVFLQQIASFDRPRDAELDEDYVEGVLAARLEMSGKDCEESSWARAAELPAPALATISDARGALRQAAIKRFRQDPEYRKHQKQYRAEGHTGQWVRFEDQALEVKELVSAGERLLFLSSSVGGCGDFEASMTRVYRLGEDDALENVPVFTRTAVYGLDAAADMDGDGDLELVVHEDGFDKSLMLQNERGFEAESSNRVAIFYCRC